MGFAEDPPAKRRIVFVVGSGRSGTSTMTGALQTLGMHVPQPEVAADETNPKGFGEPQWVVDFHTELLQRCNVQVSDSRRAALRRHPVVRHHAPAGHRGGRQQAALLHDQVRRGAAHGCVGEHDAAHRAGQPRLRDIAEETWQHLDKLAVEGGDTPDIHERLDELRAAYAELYDEAEAIASSSTLAAHREGLAQKPA